MTKNPFLNALSAYAYIALVVLVLFSFVDKIEHSISPQFMFLMPLTMLSLFVLSAAVMGYVFLYEPMLMMLDGKRKEGATLFVKTVGTFAALALATLVVLVSLAL